MSRTLLSLAGFQVILIGRFWVIAEVGVSAYRVGIHRGTESASVAPVPNQANQIAPQQQVSDAGHERGMLRSQIEQRDKAVASLRHELEQQSAVMGRMKIAGSQMETDLHNGQAGRVFFKSDLT